MKYIVGLASKLGVTEKPPRLICIGGVDNRQPRVVWHAHDVIVRTMFGVKRGIVQEDRDFATNEIIYARVLPVELVSSERNRPLIPSIVHRDVKPANVVQRGPKSSDEAYADVMDKRARQVALALGICPDCGEDMKVIEGRGWVCMVCTEPNLIDTSNEDIHGGHGL